MATDPRAPADTTMMRIVHDALRRDLGRARSALGSDPLPDALQRAAIASHLRWMMEFLHAHHRSEDEGLYPLVLERDPDARELLDAMAQDHRAVAVAAAAVERAAAPPPTALDGDELLRAVDALDEVLLPHLRREEDEAMPVVSAVVTAGEWTELEQRHNLAGKSAAQLGREGHWLIDGASPGDRATVLGLVPPLQRLLLVHGFGASYRRAARARWRPQHLIQHSGTVTVDVAADVDAVWAVVRDPTRVGEWSHECQGATWVGGATEAGPGARFRGRNRQGVLRWGRLCEVLRVDPHALVWRTVPTRLYPDSSEWTIRLTPVEGGGTRITQSFEVVKGTVLEPLYAKLAPAHRDRTEALRHDLRRIGSLAAGRPEPAGVPVPGPSA